MARDGKGRRRLDRHQLLDWQGGERSDGIGSHGLGLGWIGRRLQEALQEALPFKSKPKQDVKRSSKRADEDLDALLNGGAKATPTAEELVKVAEETVRVNVDASTINLSKLRDAAPLLSTRSSDSLRRNLRC